MDDQMNAIMALVRDAERAMGEAREPASEPVPAPTSAPVCEAPPGRIDGHPDLARLLLAGRARVTLVSPRTGVRYTYRIASPKDDPRGNAKSKLAGKPRPCYRCDGSGVRYRGECYGCHGTGTLAPRAADDGVRFVSLLTGSDNTRDYSYLGIVRGVGGRPVYTHGGAKARLGADAPGARAVEWMLGRVLRGEAPGCEVWHQGACLRCGLDLTVPESIARGLGPECAGMV